MDAKKRLLIRGAKYQFYKVKEYENGCVLLEPRELVAPIEISKKTLESMDRAIENVKVEKVSETVDLSDF